MVSVINYRFFSLKGFSKITFEGTGLQAWELKSEIIMQKQMQSEDFDLQLYEADSEVEMEEDEIIYRNSFVIVKRIPLWMAKPKPLRERPSIKQKKGFRQPPMNYVCFRCGQKGHYIQFCPTNNDRTYDIVRIRKPTGIPKAFLELTSSDKIPEAASKLVTTEGLVQIKPQTKEWDKIKKSIKPSIPDRLACKVCKTIYFNAVRTNCGHDFCDRCVKMGCKCIICKSEITSKRDNLGLRNEVNRFIKK